MEAGRQGCNAWSWLCTQPGSLAEETEHSRTAQTTALWLLEVLTSYLDLLPGYRVLILGHGGNPMQVLQEIVVFCSAAKSLGEWHSSLLAEQEEVIACTEPRRGKDFEWKGQSRQCFCETDFSTTNCRCRDTARAEINDMEEAERAHNGHWGKLL